MRSFQAFCATLPYALPVGWETSLQRWHPQFSLASVPDVPPAPLPIPSDADATPVSAGMLVRGPSHSHASARVAAAIAAAAATAERASAPPLPLAESTSTAPPTPTDSPVPLTLRERVCTSYARARGALPPTRLGTLPPDMSLHPRAPGASGCPRPGRDNGRFVPKSACTLQS